MVLVFIILVTVILVHLPVVFDVALRVFCLLYLSVVLEYVCLVFLVVDALALGLLLLLCFACIFVLRCAYATP